MDNQPDLTPEEPQSPFRRPLLRFILALVITAVVATGLALTLDYLLFDTFYVNGDSMQPTLDGGDINVDTDGDVVMLNIVATPERGDIVVFKADWTGEEEYFLVKRVIGVPGDTVEIRNGELYLNGELQEEDYIKEPMYDYTYPPVTVPEGHYYVLGDNRNNSSDSRVIGCVPEDKIVGVCWLYKGTDGKLHLL